MANELRALDEKLTREKNDEVSRLTRENQ